MDCTGIQSTSSPRMTWKYDVFLSFRGETRNNFTDHLFAALHRKGIFAFKDDTKLKKGETISAELLQAIEGSQVLIVVFSKNYASSTWCLKELAKIAYCIQVPGQCALPIFYDVNPSEVRKQSGNYEKAFAEHEERFKEDAEMMVQVRRWRGALTQVANLSGWDVRDKPHSAEIEKIAKEVTSILSHKASSLADDIVGIHSPMEELEKLLMLDSGDDVQVVGICGMGGIGKTTLATILYEKISHQYDVSCFMDDVSKTYGDYGPVGTQKQLLCQALREENFQICNLSMATNLMQTRLRHRKALIVLDNVDQGKQLEKLAMIRKWLGARSRIIIISRDKHTLRECGVDKVYKVQLLNYYNARQLFCRKAFKCNHITRGYEDLTNSAVTYANGLPLAITVLGSFLFGRDVSEWRSALARLRENPKKDIMDVLRISFDGLEVTEKEIFLDIACFFDNESETYVKKILDIRGFHPDISIRVLIDKSLITCMKGYVQMHDLLKELGRSIVKEKSPKEPGKWSRLWNYEDLCNVLLEKKATDKLEAIILLKFPENSEELLERTTLRAEALSQMSRLKLLKLMLVNFSGSLYFLSNELGYLLWEKFPFTCLPSTFQPNKLVELILHHSNIKQLWEGTKPLHNLKCMELCHSENLIKLPDFSEAPNLERLDLKGCVKLVHIDPSIGLLKRLIFLRLKNCKGLVSIPNSIFGLSSLEHLDLSGCSELFKNRLLEKPRHGEHLIKLDTSQSSIQCQLTSSIYKIVTLPLHFFHSGRHADKVGSLLPFLPRFPCLTYLDLSFCNLLQIPDAIGRLHCLESLNLGGNSFVALPCSIKELSKLTWLNLEHCEHLKYLPELPSSTILPVRKETSSFPYWPGLYVFNCSRLSDIEHCCSTAFSWMIQVIQVNQRSSFPLGQIDVLIPGTKIPRWFNEQNVGGSISLDPFSPIMDDDNWIGIACCATFVAHDVPTNFDEEVWGMHIGFGFRNKTGDGRYPMVPIHLGKDLVTTESDHMLVKFFCREVFIDEYVRTLQKEACDLEGIQLEMLSFPPPHSYVEVKSCGYRWVFKEDLEQLNPTMMQSGNSSVRKRKFLAIDDEPQP